MRTYRNFIAITSDSRFLVWMLKFSTLRHYVEEVGAELHGEGCLTCADLYTLMQWSAGYIRRTSPSEYHNFLVPSALARVLTFGRDSRADSPPAEYPFGCKRVILDPGYLESLWRANVDLVTDPIDTITEKGVLGKSGEEYELDVLILATGFDVVSPRSDVRRSALGAHRRILQSEVGLGINVVGRNGQTVTQQVRIRLPRASRRAHSCALGRAVAVARRSPSLSRHHNFELSILLLHPRTKCRFGKCFCGIFERGTGQLHRQNDLGASRLRRIKLRVQSGSRAAVQRVHPGSLE